MPKTATRRRNILNSNYLPPGVIGLALAILGATIFFTSNDLRRKSRHQLIQQQAQILYALWQSQEFSEEAAGQLGVSERTSDQLWSVLQTTQLPLRLMAGLSTEHLGTRLFDASGQPEFVDPTITDAALPPGDLAALLQFQPVAHFRSSVELSEVLNLALPETLPKTAAILEISIPLHFQNKGKLLGIAQFVLDGKEVASEFKTLDRNLIAQALATFVVGGGLLVILLGLGFRQLLRVNSLLSQRTQSLLRANQELALAAKTSAVGAVTAHLIHGLKNPLSGLHSFVASRVSSSEVTDDSEWQLAVSSTRRMQNMISQIVQVLRDEQGQTSYELSLAECVEVLQAKILPLAAAGGVQFQVHLAATAVLTNREANLINLILFNLIQNAIQATPEGKGVALTLREVAGQIECEVADQGHGFSIEQLKSVFQPCQSTKDGGSGIGLAISKQLAGCIGADLELKNTSPAGSVFALRFPSRPNQDRGTRAKQVTLT